MNDEFNVADLCRILIAVMAVVNYHNDKNESAQAEPYDKIRKKVESQLERRINDHPGELSEVIAKLFVESNS